jgi:DNA polymerase-3 subunit gamma/tau
VLARKYRPRTLRGRGGPRGPHARAAGALQEDRVGHAYLFCGPRGTGKTTTARILAKALNCERGAGPSRAACASAAGDRRGPTIDVIEIDAASNRGVDDVRELRERWPTRRCGRASRSTSWTRSTC